MDLVLVLADEVNTTDEANNLVALNGVIAFISATFILPVIQQPSWSHKVRALVTFLYSLIVGAATTWFAGDFDPANIATSVLSVFVIAIATYHGFAQPTKIAPAIENATSGGSRRQTTDDPPA
jgi:hypothetical protein